MRNYQYLWYTKNHVENEENNHGETQYVEQKKYYTINYCFLYSSC